MQCDKVIRLLGLMKPNSTVPNSCNSFAMVLEYMEGGSLDGLLNSIYRNVPASGAASASSPVSPLTIEEIREISLDVIEGLVYLHSFVCSHNISLTDILMLFSSQG